MLKIYLAHPISGLSGQEVFIYYENLKNKLSGYYEMLCPMTGKECLREEEIFKAKDYTLPLATNHAIYNRDKWMVTNSDIVLCDFTGARTASIGCCMELAIANCFGKNIVVVMDKDNIHNHAFVKEASTVIYETLNEAVSYLRLLATSLI